MQKLRLQFGMMFILILLADELPSQTFIPLSVTDQTPTSSLSNPTPGVNKIRYISGFGADNVFTLFLRTGRQAQTNFPSDMSVRQQARPVFPLLLQPQTSARRIF